MYREWLWKQIKESHITKADLLELKGKDLICYCSPKSCYGDILLKAVEWASHNKAENKKKEISNKVKH